jgi:cytochrome c oxidase subunit IV
MSHSSPAVGHQHILPVRAYLQVFGALLALLFLTVAAYRWLDLGPWNLVIALLIATTKAVLILLYFMHVRFSNKLTWVFSGASFFWLGILLILTMSDYTTRLWLPIPGK